MGFRGSDEWKSRNLQSQITFDKSSYNVFLMVDKGKATLEVKWTSGFVLVAVVYPPSPHLLASEEFLPFYQE